MNNNDDIPTTNTTEINQLINRVKQGELDQGDAQLIVFLRRAGIMPEEIRGKRVAQVKTRHRKDTNIFRTPDYSPQNLSALMPKSHNVKAPN